MIEDEIGFRAYLESKKRNNKFRLMADRYIDCLHKIKEQIDENITLSHIKNIDEVKSLVFGLRATHMPESQVKECDLALRAYLRFNRHKNHAYQHSKEKSFFEGETTKELVNKYERDVTARKKCISYHGTTCKVCSLSFSNVYGHIGEGFIHVHHIVPLSHIRETYCVDPIKDLVPVCPNCHSMLHRRNPPYTIDELIGIMAQPLKIGNRDINDF